MSVEVKNGISVLKSSAGAAIKFKGSEDDPVLVSTGLESCPVYGPRSRNTTRAKYEREVLSYLVEAEEVDWVPVELPDDQNVRYLHNLAITFPVPVILGPGSEFQKIAIVINDEDVAVFDLGELVEIFSGSLDISLATFENELPIQLSGGAELTLELRDDEDGVELPIQGKAVVTLWTEVYDEPEVLDVNTSLIGFIQAVDDVAGDPIDSQDLAFYRWTGGDWSAMNPVATTDSEGNYAIDDDHEGYFVAGERYLVVGAGGELTPENTIEFSQESPLSQDPENPSILVVASE